MAPQNSYKHKRKIIETDGHFIPNRHIHDRSLSSGTSAQSGGV